MQNSKGLSQSARLETKPRELERQLESRTEDKALENRLRETNAALKRLDAGIYGVCFDCAKPIPYPRLEADPLAIRDTECQQAYDAIGQNPATTDTAPSPMGRASRRT